GALACGGGGKDQAARCIVAGGGDGSGVVLGGVGRGAGPEFATAADFVRHGVDVCRETSHGLVPSVGEPTQRFRPPRFDLRDGRSRHLAPKRSPLRRSARSKASADMWAATAQPRMLATTSVSFAATRTD